MAFYRCISNGAVDKHFAILKVNILDGSVVGRICYLYFNGVIIASQMIYSNKAVEFIVTEVGEYVTKFADKQLTLKVFSNNLLNNDTVEDTYIPLPIGIGSTFSTGGYNFLVTQMNETSTRVVALHISGPTSWSQAKIDARGNTGKYQALREHWNVTNSNVENSYYSSLPTRTDLNGTNVKATLSSLVKGSGSPEYLWIDETGSESYVAYILNNSNGVTTANKQVTSGYKYVPAFVISDRT